VANKRIRDERDSSNLPQSHGNRTMRNSLVRDYLFVAVIAGVPGACATYQQAHSMLELQQAAHEEHKTLASTQEQRKLIEDLDQRYLERIKASEAQGATLRSALTTLAGPLDFIPGGKLVGGLIAGSIDSAITPVKESAEKATAGVESAKTSISAVDSKVSGQEKKLEEEERKGAARDKDLQTLADKYNALDESLRKKLDSFSKDPELVAKINEIATQVKDPERLRDSILRELKLHGLSEDEIKQMKPWSLSELLSLLGVAGGSAGLLGSRLGPSRSKKDVDALKEKVADLQRKGPG